MSHIQKKKETRTVKKQKEAQNLKFEAMLSLLYVQDSVLSLLSDLVDSLSIGKVPEEQINSAKHLADTVNQVSHALLAQIHLGESGE